MDETNNIDDTMQNALTDAVAEVVNPDAPKEETPKTEPEVKEVEENLDDTETKVEVKEEEPKGKADEVEPKEETEVEEASGEEASNDEGFPVTDEFDGIIKEMEDEGDYSPKFIELFKGMSAMLKGQAKEIASLKKAGYSAEVNNFFDRQINRLGEGVAKHIDAASRTKLESKFKILEKAYSGDKSMSRDKIFKEAATLAIGDILAKAEAEGKAAKLKERRALVLARPGGERGQQKMTEPVSAEEAVADAVFKALTE